MNFYEAQRFFSSMFKDKKVSFEFDESCIRFLESVYTDGKLHVNNHVEYQQLKVSPEGMESFYVPIQPHRMLASAAYIKKKISNDQIHFNQQHKDIYAKASEEEKPLKLKEFSELTGMAEAEIKKQLE